MAKSQFYNDIHGAQEERDIDKVYTKWLYKYFKNSPITYPFKCDSYLETITEKGQDLRLLVEYKYDENFSSKTAVCKVLIQVLFYIKRFEQEGRPLPNVVLVGDKNECFVLQTNILLPYLDFEDVDWSIAPSDAPQECHTLLVALVKDNKITPFVYDVDENFSFINVADNIIDQADNVERLIRVTEHNIASIYEHFCNRVVREPEKIQEDKLVSTFIGTILETDSYFQHPSKPNILVTPNGNIKVDGSSYNAFTSHFIREYTPLERHKFTEISDRLVEDTKRRRNGEFYTPTPFANYAHQMLDEELGYDWREKFVVWDCCWGTGNLTRDYRFTELYASNKFESEITIGEPYNREAKKFVFDFLNDEIVDMFGKHVPEELLQALKDDKPILFFINPPYARNSGDNNVGTSDEVCFTKVRETMNKQNMGVCVSNLYAQFLYRIIMIREEYHLSNVNIGFFSPTLYLSGESWKQFRKSFLYRFSFTKACTFKASYFADVSPTWGISFSIWKHGETTSKDNFEHKTIDVVDGTIKATGTINIYNVDEQKTASIWLREETKSLKTYEYIELTSAIKVREKEGSRRGRLVKNALGYFYNKSNNIDKNTSAIALFSAAFSDNVGTSIIPSNFYKCTSLFSARKLISKNWMNSKDEYLAPNEQHPHWKEFVGDSLVYSLFHSNSEQSSLRNKEYKGKTWQIYNEFFFMSREEIMQLTEKNKLYDTYEEVRTDKERFVYQLLELACGRGDASFEASLPELTRDSLPKTLSTEAVAVLEKAREITRNTFQFRQLFHDEHPEYQILNWDCGWYQIKALAKDYKKKEMAEFDSLYKALADKMRPMVYEVGFLK